MIDMILVKKRIKEVESKYDFDDLKDKFRMSGASIEDREEAIRLLEIEFPQYVVCNRHRDDILVQIEESMADIDGTD